MSDPADLPAEHTPPHESVDEDVYAPVLDRAALEADSFELELPAPPIAVPIPVWIVDCRVHHEPIVNGEGV